MEVRISTKLFLLESLVYKSRFSAWIDFWILKIYVLLFCFVFLSYFINSYLWPWDQATAWLSGHKTAELILISLNITRQEFVSQKIMFTIRQISQQLLSIIMCIMCSDVDVDLHTDSLQKN